MFKIVRQKIFNISTFSAIFIITVIYLQTASAFSLREFLGLDEPKTEEKTPQKPAPQPALQKNPPVATVTPEEVTYSLDYDELQQIVSVIDQDQRKVVLGDETAFKNFVKNEASNKSILSAAHANKIDQNKRNLFIVRRGAENIIREIYLKQLIATKIPADFPSEERIKEYYEKNKERFVIGERIHVWQIFLQKPETADKKEIELLKKQAETIITDINKGKMDFSAAAKKYSSPPGAKYNGGYMGLVNVSDLRPEIKDPLLALATDKISTPIETEQGIHILKRGNIIPKQELQYNEVNDQIANTLRKQLQNQLRRAVYKQAAETYPVDIDDKTIEEWRLKLRTNIPARNTEDNNSQASG
jgi:peptidylprolyl isomerase